ncbi:MAG: histidinol-phosphate transaminase [Chloroflexi bacterium]|nr:histidinol-phosphate transaminase [Chloroflexota bacterium]
MANRRAVERLIREDLSRAGPYVPIRSIEVISETCRVPLDQIVKLDGNENPYGCSPAAKRALAEYPYYHIYPDPEQIELRKALQKYAGAEASRILVGSGSDELIDLLIRLVINPEDEIIDCPPTFGMYSFCTRVCGGKVVMVARDDNFDISTDAIKWETTPRTKIIFVASPNNPSGNVVIEKQVRELLELGVLVVVDEAYYEFSGCTVMSLTSKYDNLVVLRTFSKWAGLAGLRVGYGVFPEQLVSHLMKIKQPYNINAAAQVAALHSLADADYLLDTVSMIVRERARLFHRLQEFDFLEPRPSQANFILCRVTNGKARHIWQGLQRHGVFIRYFNTSLLKEYIRVSVGKPEHTEALVQAIATLVEEDKEAERVQPKL